MATRANSGVIQNSQGNIWLDASQAQNYGLQSGVYTPDQLNNAGSSYSKFLDLSPEAQAAWGAGGGTFGDYGVANNTAFDSMASTKFATDLASSETAGNGTFYNDWLKSGPGGSAFSNTAQGLGSLYGIYATNRGINAAEDALGFEKQKYADLKALQAKSDANKEKFGLALQSASRANGLVK